MKICLIYFGNMDVVLITRYLLVYPELVLAPNCFWPTLSAQCSLSAHSHENCFSLMPLEEMLNNQNN